MTELLTSGIELMMVGMGIVFVFLAMLVFAIKLMSSMILRYFPDAPAQGRPRAGAAIPDTQLIAAISTAVHRYRNTHKS